MAVLKYASMAELKEAIQARRVIRFTYHGDQFEAEPHALDCPLARGGFYLTAWVAKAPNHDLLGWANFRYSEMRAMDVLPRVFLARAVPRFRRDSPG
jgi:hypothetical protein